MQTSKEAGPTAWSRPHVTPPLGGIVRVVGSASYLNLSIFFTPLCFTGLTVVPYQMF